MTIQRASFPSHSVNNSPAERETADVSDLFKKMAVGEGRADEYIQVMSGAGTPAQAAAVRKRRAMDAPFALALAGQVPGELAELGRATTPGDLACRAIRMIVSADRKMWIAPNGLPLVPAVGMYVGAEPWQRDDLRRLFGPQMLLAATMLGDDATAKKLVDDGMGVHGVDEYNNTALHWATLTGQTDLANHLRRAGAKETPNAFHATPSDYLPRFGPAVPVVAGVQAEGSSEEKLVSADELRRVAGFELLDQSRLGPDWMLQTALTAFDSQVAPGVREELPLEPLPKGRAPLLLLKHSPELGWGVHARESIPAGTCLASYTGELVHKADSQLRERRYGLMAYNQKLFEMPGEKELEEHFPFSIDGEFAGSLAGRFNSTHAPGYDNVRLKSGFRAGRPVVDFYAKHDLKPGEQLVWYYGGGYWDAAGTVPRPLTAKDGFFWPPNKKPDNGLARAMSLASGWSVAGYVPHIVDLSALASAASLVGIDKKGAGLFTKALAFARLKGQKPFFIFRYLHQAPADVQQVVIGLFTGKHAYHDEFVQADIPRGEAAPLFVDTPRALLPAPLRDTNENKVVNG